MPKHVSFPPDVYIPRNTYKCHICKYRDVMGNEIMGKKEMAKCISCLKSVCYTTCFVNKYDVCTLCYNTYYHGILFPRGM